MDKKVQMARQVQLENKDPLGELDPQETKEETGTKDGRVLLAMLGDQEREAQLEPGVLPVLTVSLDQMDPMDLLGRKVRNIT